MNKGNKLLVGCLALLLVLSVGYALFSETITINGTATAKGSFDIVATCQAGFMDELVDLGAYSSLIQSENNYEYEKESCSVTNNVVTFNTTLLQPGAKRYFTVKLTNKGSIPATLDGEKLTDDYLLSNKTTKVCSLLEDDSVSENCTQNIEYIDDTGRASSNPPTEENRVAVKVGDKLCDFFDNSCMSGFSSLNTDDAIYYIIPLVWPENYASGYEYGFQGTVSVQIPLIQYAE